MIVWRRLEERVDVGGEGGGVVVGWVEDEAEGRESVGVEEGKEKEGGDFGMVDVGRGYCAVVISRK